MVLVEVVVTFENEEGEKEASWVEEMPVKGTVCSLLIILIVILLR